jgi:hypothetical protein
VPIALVRAGLRALGAVTIQVSGVSMLPTLRAGQRVVLRPAERDRLRPGVVAAFQSRDGDLVLHRIRHVAPDAVILAGDNESLLDPPVPVPDVVGVVDDLPPAPPPPRWSPVPAGSGPVEVWVRRDRPADGIPLPAPLPPGWRLHARPAEGIGVSDAVLDEIRGAVPGGPCLAVTHQAVHAAAEVLTGPLPPGTRVLVGFPLGRLTRPMPQGNLVPSDLAGTHVRVGPPAVPLPWAEMLARLVALTGGPA